MEEMVVRLLSDLVISGILMFLLVRSQNMNVSLITDMQKRFDEQTRVNHDHVKWLQEMQERNFPKGAAA